MMDYTVPSGSVVLDVYSPKSILLRVEKTYTPFLVPSLSAPPRSDRRRVAVGHVSMAAAPSEAWSFSSTGSAG